MGSVISSETKPKGWWGRNWAIAVAVVFLLAVWLRTPVWIRFWMGPVEESALTSAGQFGDQFGAINALFTAFTVLLVFIAFQGERRDRKEADNRWRQERAEAERESTLLEVDRRTRTFFESLERFVRAREAVQFRWYSMNHRTGQGVHVAHERRAVALYHAGFKEALSQNPSEYLGNDEPDSRLEFARRTRAWFESNGGQELKPMFAQAAPMNWALKYVREHEIAMEASRRGTYQMLISAARDTIAKHEFELMASYALTDTDMRQFVLAVFDLEKCDPPFALHQLEWLGDGVVAFQSNDAD